MYKKQKADKTSINVNSSYEGERIEEKIMRITNNKEPISDGAPTIYTDRKDGVKPEYDIRTDRWEIAVDAMDAVTKQKLAERENRQKPIGEQAKEGMDKEGKKDGEAKTIHGTDGTGENK